MKQINVFLARYLQAIKKCTKTQFLLCHVPKCSTTADHWPLTERSRVVKLTEILESHASFPLLFCKAAPMKSKIFSDIDQSH